MSLLLVTHESSGRHRTPAGHPERPARVDAVVSGIRSTSLEIVDLEAPRVDRDLLEQVHDAEFIEAVHALCVRGGGRLDPDTFAVPATWDAAIHAAGAGVGAVDALRRGRADSAFVAVRPPGHHAERAQAMGFCIFNNVAVTAAYLRSRGNRVAVVDWDVHHGNGTQRTFYRDPDVLYVSLHEFPFYPGTGWVNETGSGPGEGATVNIALPNGTTASSYLAAFARIVVPIIDQFAPDWILVSAGYDAHLHDPLGGLRLLADDYGALAASLARLVPANRIIAFLEGGYDLEAIADSAAATVLGSLGHLQPDPFPTEVDGSAARTVELTVEALAEHWEVV